MPPIVAVAPEPALSTPLIESAEESAAVEIAAKNFGGEKRRYAGEERKETRLG